jgi:hypothetical protein
MQKKALIAFGGFVTTASIGLVYLIGQPQRPITVVAAAAGGISTATDRLTTSIAIADASTINQRITVEIDRPAPPGLPPWAVVLATMPEPPPASVGETPAPTVPQAALGR